MMAGGLGAARTRAFLDELQALLDRHDVEIMAERAPDRLLVLARRRAPGMRLVRETRDGVEIQMVPLGEPVEQRIDALMGAAMRVGATERHEDTGTARAAEDGE